jgi:hypothetical protein
MIDDYDWDRLDGLGFAESAKEGLKSACWKGYEAIGMKSKGGRKVPNCVKVKDDAEHGEGDIAMAAMTPNFLPKEPGAGDEKNPQMGEGVPIRMPRSDVIAKASDNNGQLAMAAAPNYSENPLNSEENNASMAITQLRAMREKIDILLGILYPDDNIPPWCSVKITNAGTGLASVADFIRFGSETL